MNGAPTCIDAVYRFIMFRFAAFNFCPIGTLWHPGYRI